MIIMIPPESAETIVCIAPNDAPGTQTPQIPNIKDKLKYYTFPELESSRADPTLGSTRAGGQDEGSYHNPPQTTKHITIVHTLGLEATRPPPTPLYCLV